MRKLLTYLKAKKLTDYDYLAIVLILKKLINKLNN